MVLLLVRHTFLDKSRLLSVARVHEILLTVFDPWNITFKLSMVLLVNAATLNIGTVDATVVAPLIHDRKLCAIVTHLMLL